MINKASLTALLSPALLLASCGASPVGDSGAASTPAPSGKTVESTGREFLVEEKATFDEPWAAAFWPGTDVLFVTEKKGRIKFVQPNGTMGFVQSGVPQVDYGGQGGLGDIAFGPGTTSADGTIDRATLYLSFVEPSEGDTRGAAVGKGTLVCADHDSCDLRDFRVIWRQTPKVTGRGHFSHRLAFSPDGKYLFVASGDRQKMDPAQDVSNTLGSIVRLTLDGQPAPGNPFADRSTPSNQIWSYGHRNILGLQFDDQGRLWDLEHGPQGGDELNLVRPGANYGWPLVSDGVHYGGGPIPNHSTRPDLAAPALSWTSVIAPGDFTFYSGSMFPEWRGDALIAAMKPSGLVRVEFDGDNAREVARYPFDRRIRDIVEARDGSIWLLEDKEEARLLRLHRD